MTVEGQAAAAAGRGPAFPASRSRRPSCSDVAGRHRRCASSIGGPSRASTTGTARRTRSSSALALAERLGSELTLRLADRLRAARARARVGRAQRPLPRLRRRARRRVPRRGLRRRARRRPRHERQDGRTASPTSLPRRRARRRGARRARGPADHRPATSSTTPRSARARWVHLARARASTGRARCWSALPGRRGRCSTRARRRAALAPADRIGDLVVLADSSTVLGRRERRARPLGARTDACARTAAGTSRRCRCCSRCR